VLSYVLAAIFAESPVIKFIYFRTKIKMILRSTSFHRLSPAKISLPQAFICLAKMGGLCYICSAKKKKLLTQRVEERHSFLFKALMGVSI
jgi:hypothetical protein